jgi:hypothetical protein
MTPDELTGVTTSGIGGSEVWSFELRFNGLELIRVSDAEAGQCQHERTPR